jgi:hypothetical protein
MSDGVRESACERASDGVTECNGVNSGRIR